jgi:hypothetical protein
MNYFQNNREMLKRVQHDKKDGVFSVCHPEPCPELVSGLFRDLGFGFRGFR